MKTAIVCLGAVVVLLSPLAADAADEPLPEPATDLPPAPPPPPRRRATFTARFDGDFAYRSLWGIGFQGGDFDVTIGPQWRRVALLFRGSYWGASTVNRLGAHEAALSIMVEFNPGRLRLGIGMTHGYFSLERVGMSESSAGFSSGPTSYLSYDIVQFTDTDRSALYLRAAFDAQVVMGDAMPALWGPSVGLGARL
jgi:hypothetical protein